MTVVLDNDAYANKYIGKKIRRQQELILRKAKRFNSNGEFDTEVELDKEIFGLIPNVALMHQVVTAYLASIRSGTRSTKTRAEVRGGGAKPFRQKGTGRARQGTTRAPQFTGGGVALGPKPQNHDQKTPKKMVRASLNSALSDRAKLRRVAIIERFDFETPSTKEAIELLEKIKVRGKILVVLNSVDDNAALSFRNLPNVTTVEISQLTTYAVLSNDWIVFTDSTLLAGKFESSDANAPISESVSV